MEINVISNHWSNTSGSYDSEVVKIHRNRTDFDGINIITEPHIWNINLLNQLRGKKIGWLCESKEVFSYSTSKIHNSGILDKLDYILTHDKSLIEWKPEKFLYTIPATNRRQVPPEEVKIHPKTKDISFCFSNKQMTSGHRLRHQMKRLIQENNLPIEMHGSGVGKPYNGDSMHAYRDYRYSIIIENSTYDYYWSEKPQECFWTGTIPIYIGTDSLYDVYNKDGVIKINSVDEILDLLPILNEETYVSKMDYIKDNFERSLEYRVCAEEFFTVKYWEKWNE